MTNELSDEQKPEWLDLGEIVGSDSDSIGIEPRIQYESAKESMPGQDLAGREMQVDPQTPPGNLDRSDTARRRTPPDPSLYDQSNGNPAIHRNVTVRAAPMHAQAGTSADSVESTENIPTSANELLGGNQPPPSGSVGGASVGRPASRDVETSASISVPGAPVYLITSYEHRQAAIAAVYKAITEVEDFEGTELERLVCDYALVDLRFVRSALNLEIEAVEEVLLAAREDLEAASNRLSRVVDACNHPGGQVVLNLLATAIWEIGNALAQG